MLRDSGANLLVYCCIFVIDVRSYRPSAMPTSQRDVTSAFTMIFIGEKKRTISNMSDNEKKRASTSFLT